MVTAEQLAARKQEIVRSRDLMALVAHLTEQAAPVLDRMPPIPREKALLSSDGGVCPEDGAPLAFDPWSPDAHRCPRCGRTFGGERHDRNWARYQHLWLAERAAHLAALVERCSPGSSSNSPLMRQSSATYHPSSLASHRASASSAPWTWQAPRTEAPPSEMPRAPTVVAPSCFR